MKFYIALFVSKLIYISLKILRRPATAFAGFVALKICPDFMNHTQKYIQKGFINITGTNGKTTTSGILAHILENNNKKIIHNLKGANMLSGIANVFVRNICPLKKFDFAVIETDEAYLTKLYNHIQANCLVVTNLFADQLDRYGEADFTAKIIQEAINKNDNLKLILNADDEVVKEFGKNKNAIYFGIKNDADYFATTTIHDDNIELLINNEYRFKINIIGEYNAYNALAAIATALENGLTQTEIQQALDSYRTAFGRAEKRIINERETILQLIKNPAGMSEVLKSLNTDSHIIIAINDAYADGRDISWIWDVNLDKLKNTTHPITTSGIRAYDIAVRLKHAGIPTEKINVIPNIQDAIKSVTSNISKDEKITILPSYTALLKISKY